MLFFFFFLPRLPLISSLLTNPSYPLLWFACVGDPVWRDVWYLALFGVCASLFLSFLLCLSLSLTCVVTILLMIDRFVYT